MRRRDDAHVDLAIAGGAERLDLLALERAQKTRLQLERQLADLVEEQRAAVRLHERAVARLRAPVNAPRAWPNSSLSMSDAGTAAQSNTTNGPCARGLRA